MNKKVLTILLMAFVVSAGCAFAVWQVMSQNIAATHQAGVKRVVAAAGNIQIGAVLAASNLTTIEIKGTLPKGAIMDVNQAVGRGVTSDLYEGEPILESRLAAVGSGGGLAATIPTGMRVCAVKVDEVVGVAGFVTPGMRVDVLISGMPPGAQPENQGPEVKTLLQNIEVKSAGTDIQKDAEGKPHQVQVVNLLVTPEQAETLSLASSQTRIQLALRNPLDQVIAKVPGNAMANLFAGVNGAPQKPKAAPVGKSVKRPASSVYAIEVINGSVRSEEKFAAPEVKQ